MTKVKDVMDRVRPDVVITFGPLGTSRHDDHIAVHLATVAAFHRYRASAESEPRLLYVALPKEVADQFEMDIDGPETQPTHYLDLNEEWPTKVAALRLYRSQEDAQELAEIFQQAPWRQEAFHQAYPPLPEGYTATSLWPS